MNLAIDVGNTRVKVAVFADNSLVWTDVFDKSEFEKAFHHILQKYPDLTHCILAMVGSFSGSLLALVGQRLKLLTLHSDTALPFKNDYGSPKTLGVDRMALTAAAVNRYPGKDVLIIDAGSCITYDLITSEGNYKGGAISPGLKMRYRALHTFTEKLPLLSPEQIDSQTGKDTNQSIQVGIIHAIGFEIEGFIVSFTDIYPNLTVILTGGDAEFLRERLKSDIFAHSNFLLEGLNYILEHNKH